jgi:integrase
MVRVSELVNIKRKNVDFKSLTMQLEVADTKIRVARTVPISAKTAKLLSKYMVETENFGNDQAKWIGNRRKMEVHIKCLCGQHRFRMGESQIYF